MNAEPDNGITKRQVPAVTRAVAILRFLARSSGPAGVNPIARELGLVPSTCLHILRALQDEGLVDFDSVTKRYSIGIGILPLARSALQKNTFSSLVQPLLSDLSARFGVTSVATQLAEPGQMVVVALSQSNLPFRLQVDLGSRFPALISATGRCFAAFNPIEPKELRAKFARLTWDNPPSFDDWQREVQHCRETGYAIDNGSYISGVTVVAVPVFGENGRMVRSLVAIGITERLPEGEVPKMVAALLEVRDNVQGLQIHG